jgi:hypothetical protein
MDTIILRTTEEVAAGDPFIAAGHDNRRGCPACFGGFVTMTIEEDGEESFEAVPCKRCAAGENA